jgi:pimeloyl-ACP methyl ester carboxylesterase
MTPVKYSDYLAGTIPRSRKAIIDGATHFVQLERYREVNRTIAEFLEGLG